MSTVSPGLSPEAFEWINTPRKTWGLAVRGGDTYYIFASTAQAAEALLEEYFRQSRIGFFTCDAAGTLIPDAFFPGVTAVWPA